VTAPLPPHRLAVRVYYEDTDAAGIVYHASYLRFAERARAEMLRERCGLGQDELRREHGVVFAVRRCGIEFVAPARLDDLVEVETVPVRLGGARLVVRQTVTRADRALAVLEVELAVLDAVGLRPRRLPDAVREALTS
jgi:acyl-CoA thioester hydrolase